MFLFSSVLMFYFTGILFYYFSLFLQGERLYFTLCVCVCVCVCVWSTGILIASLDVFLSVKYGRKQSSVQ